MTHTDFIINWTLVVLLLISLALGKIPKSYQGKFWNFLITNYHKHIFLGGLIGMILSLTYSGVPIPIQIFLTLFVTGVIAVSWEWGWAAYNKSKPDYNDVYVAVVAALIAVILHMKFQ